MLLQNTVTRSLADDISQRQDIAAHDAGEPFLGIQVASGGDIGG